jgi:hypothetical protein
MKQYHKRFYLYGKTVPELLDNVNEFTKQYSVGNIFDVQITEVLEKEIEVQTNYDNGKEIDNSNPSDANRIKTTIFKYSYYAIVLILIEE